MSKLKVYLNYLLKINKLNYNNQNHNSKLKKAIKLS